MKTLRKYEKKMKEIVMLVDFKHYFVYIRQSRQKIDMRFDSILK